MYDTIYGDVKKNKILNCLILVQPRNIKSNFRFPVNSNLELTNYLIDLHSIPVI